MPVVSFDYVEKYEQMRAENEKLRAALQDLVRLVDEDKDEDAPPYLVDQVLDRARAALEEKP